MRHCKRDTDCNFNCLTYYVCIFVVGPGETNAEAIIIGNGNPAGGLKIFLKCFIIHLLYLT